MYNEILQIYFISLLLKSHLNDEEVTALPTVKDMQQWETKEMI